MDVLKEYQEQLSKLLVDAQRAFAGVRTNRPHTGLVEDLKVNHYGGAFPVKQLGSVGVMPPREIRIEVWDAGAVAAVAKAIESSALGLTANTEGNVVRIFLPELSDERRAELVRYVSKVAEEHRIKVRHARDEANKKIQKMFEAGEVGEDQKFKLKESVQKATGEWNEEVEKLVEVKNKEISN